jgi:hypothetical protein
MPKYRIEYGIGVGSNYVDEIEAGSLEEAHEQAYQEALQLFDSEASYSAEEID